MRTFGCVPCLVSEKMLETRKKFSFQFTNSFEFCLCIMFGGGKKIFQFVDCLNVGYVTCLDMENREREIFFSFSLWIVLIFVVIRFVW